MSKLAEATLILGVALSVLAFGGTDLVFFAFVQLLFFAVAALLIATSTNSQISFPPKVIAVPAVLAGVVLLQLCPMPASWFGRSAESAIAIARPGHISSDPYSTRTQFLILVACFVAFFLAQIVSRDRSRKRRLIVSLVALGTFEAFYGLVQYLSGWQKIFTYVKKFDLEEATGTYINRNHFAGLLEMILPFCLALLFYEYVKLRRDHPQPVVGLKTLAIRPGVQRVILWLAVAVILFAALIFSRSRMGILAASISLLVVFGLAGISQFREKAASLLVVTFMVLCVGLALWIGPGPIVGRFQNVGDEYALGDQSRLSIWRDTIPLIEHRPLLGNGLGAFPVVYTAGQTAFLGKFVNHAHNDYLELAADLGLPAAIILFVSICLILAHSIRSFLSGEGDFERIVALGCAGSIVAILLHSLADFNLYIPANALLFSLILGLAVSAPLPKAQLGRHELGL
jgi:O-antigen ligase